MNYADRTTREVYGAGRWFPADGSALKAMVQQFIDDAAAPMLAGKVVAGIAPHAGYVFSGPVAGHTFRAFRDSAEKWGAPETVVILGFSHRGGFKGTALMDGDAIQTPVGRVGLDVKAGELLQDSYSSICFDYAPHRGEHSAENEIPFAQIALPDASLVVGLVGDHEEQTVEELAQALEELSNKKEIVVVASSDMLHDPDYKLVSETDRSTLDKIEAMDIAGLRSEWSYSNQILCGLSPVSAAIKWAGLQGVSKGAVLQYRNSGDDYPESRGSWVVGYGSVVFAG